MRTRSLRLRVAIAAGAAIALATVLLGVTVIALSEREEASSRDAALRDGATQVAQLSALAPALLTAPGALEGRVGSRRLLVEVIDRRGRIVARSASLGGEVLGTPAQIANVISTGRARYSNARLGGESLRVYGAPLAAVGSGPAAGGAVLVATGTQADERTAHRVRVLVLIAAGGAALLAIGIALVLTRRALRPLADLSAAARAIGETGDATRRLPTTGSSDEVGALSETLNAMLASLERAREAERRFVADASHELRTPLTALRGNAAYIAQHGANTDVLADLEADARRLAAQQARAQRVKRRHPHPGDVRAEQHFHARPHFFRGFVRESDREHFVRLRVPVADEIRNAAGDDPGFSGASSGKDQQRSFDVQDGFALFGVEAV